MMQWLDDVSHRPYPKPSGSFVMHMTWSDLAFLHWPVEAAVLRAQIPEALELDTFDGQAWIGVVPFFMEHTRPRFCPAFKPLSDFAELNVRTYVSYQGRPGVWFFSLDAESWLAVRGARATFSLPYFDAHMTYQRAHRVDYYSDRRHFGAPPGTFEASYKAVGEPYLAKQGSLEHWLTERYCLYSASRSGKIYRGEIHHPQWPLQKAEIQLRQNTVASSAKLELHGEAVTQHFVKSIDVVAWAPTRVFP